MSSAWRRMAKRLQKKEGGGSPPLELVPPSAIRGLDLANVADPAKLAQALQFHWAGDYQRAGQMYFELDRDHPPHFEARYLAALLAREAYALQTAIQLMHEVVEARPQFVEARYNLGVFYEEAADPRTAEYWFDRALELDPTFASALNNKGNMRLAAGDVDGAQRCYLAALETEPDRPEAQMNLAHALLMMGRYTEGWRYYEQRWRTPGFRAKNGLRGTTAPMWEGQPLDGKTLLVFAEQGFGDTIMMLRYVRPLVDEKGARLVVRVPARLVSLVERNVPEGATVIVDTLEELPPHDAIVPWMSLPYHFGTTTETVPLPEGFLTPHRFGTSGFTGPYIDQYGRTWQASGERRVGLVWAGSPLHKNDLNRSMSTALLAPLVRSCDWVTWHSFQIGPRANECHELGLEPCTYETFEQTAEALAKLDLLITVDTATAHLAGAQGVPTWLCLPAVPDMRWPLTGDRTCWYDSVRLFRQPMAGDWRSVVTALYRALR